MGSVRARRTFGVAVVAVLALFAVQVAAADDPDPRKQPVDRPNAADNASASASVLRLSDLGDVRLSEVVSSFQVEPKKNRTPHVPTCANFPGDRSGIAITGFASSSFKLRIGLRETGNSVGSSALFFESPSQSELYWEKTVRLPYIKCLAALLAFGPTSKPIKPLRIMSAKQIKIGPTGADKAAAYRLIALVQVPGGNPFVWTETAAFVKVGRTIAAIRVITSKSPHCGCQGDSHTKLARRLATRLTVAVTR